MVAGCLTFSVVARGRWCAGRIAPQRRPTGQRSRDSRCAACGEDLPCASTPDQRALLGSAFPPGVLRLCCQLLPSWPAASTGKTGIRPVAGPSRETNSPSRACKPPVMSELDGRVWHPCQSHIAYRLNCTQVLPSSALLYARQLSLILLISICSCKGYALPVSGQLHIAVGSSRTSR